MGNKTYFEFLEEEYQSLSSQLQSSLSKAAAASAASSSDSTDDIDDDNDIAAMTRTMQI
jgi:hypothetical protein